MLNNFNQQVNLEIISDNYYALYGMASCLGEGILTSLYLRPCILMITNPSLIEAASFIRSKTEIFTLYDLIIVITYQSIKRTIEGVSDAMIFFINVNETPDEFSKIVKHALNYRKSSFEVKEEKLTRNEVRALGLLLKGFTPAAIAEKLSVNEKTISSQKRSVMRKYGVQTTLELAIKDSFQNPSLSVVVSCDGL